MSAYVWKDRFTWKGRTVMVGTGAPPATAGDGDLYFTEDHGWRMQAARPDSPQVTYVWKKITPAWYRRNVPWTVRVYLRFKHNIR